MSRWNRARAGDSAAFAALVEPHRSELQVHRYRMLGSLQDAEDALQETLLAAWVGMAGFEGRLSARTWLNRIATHRCLNALRSASRRPVLADAGPPPVQPTVKGEVLWLQPYPDLMLDGLPYDGPGPEALDEPHEAISLAFVTALQLLPPNQRAVLLRRDVLCYSARESAELLGLTEDAVTSALKRARESLRAPGSPGSASTTSRFRRGTGAPRPGQLRRVKRECGSAAEEKAVPAGGCRPRASTPHAQRFDGEPVDR